MSTFPLPFSTVSDDLAPGSLEDRLQQNFDAIAAVLGSMGGGVFRGNGSPEGVVTAGVGAIYTRYDGGAGSTLYVKESGAGTNTGWSAK